MLKNFVSLLVFTVKLNVVASDNHHRHVDLSPQAHMYFPFFPSSEHLKSLYIFNLTKIRLSQVSRATAHAAFQKRASSR